MIDDAIRTVELYPIRSTEALYNYDHETLRIDTLKNIHLDNCTCTMNDPDHEVVSSGHGSRASLDDGLLHIGQGRPWLTD